VYRCGNGYDHVFNVTSRGAELAEIVINQRKVQHFWFGQLLGTGSGQLLAVVRPTAWKELSSLSVQFSLCKDFQIIQRDELSTNDLIVYAKSSYFCCFCWKLGLLTQYCSDVVILLYRWELGWLAAASTRPTERWIRRAAATDGGLCTALWWSGLHCTYILPISFFVWLGSALVSFDVAVRNVIFR